jgi:hypothetical protein
MFKKIQIRLISVLIAVFLLVFSVSSAFAAAPLALHIEVDEVFSQPSETFIATGTAVDAGLVCGTGTVTESSVVGRGREDAKVLVLFVTKYFTCSGGGTFDMNMVVLLDNTTRETTASWHIVGGTGAYAQLRGSGSLVGTPIVAYVSIHDVYDGQVH